MLNQENYSYISGYIFNKLSPLFSAEVRSQYLSASTPEELSDFINQHLDEKIQTRMFAAYRKKLSRQNKGKSLSSVELSSETRRQLAIMANHADVDMVDFVAQLITREYNAFRKANRSYGFLSDQLNRSL